MARTTYRNRIRVTDNWQRTVAGVTVLVAKASFDPTSSTQIELFTLPKGVIPLGIQSLGGATGGSNPTVDIGTSGTTDGFGNEVDADTVTLTYATGTLTGVELTADTIVYGKVGASAATGGETTILFNYIWADDGKIGG